MKQPEPRILTLNAGSSSIKFASYRTGEPPRKELHGAVDRVGLPGTNLTFSDATGELKGRINLESSDTGAASNTLVDWLEEHIDVAAISGTGHRVVFGMQHTEPEFITQDLLNELHRISPYDTDHLPAEVELIEAIRERYPEMPQVACFDTAFHTTMPRVAKILPLPRRFDAGGIRRHGFHGLSYTYLMEELGRVAGAKAAQGRVILAHLGSGASLAAVRGGKSIDTSMGLTPAGGLMMGTRTGDLDPGVAWYLMKSENLTPAQFNHLINHDSGLLGISETSSDMRDLLAKESEDIRVAEAVASFCYQVKKWMGAFTAVLGGLDILVFAGGIGENCADIRSRICEGCGFLGIDLDEKRNASNDDVISAEGGRVVVRVMRTDEELIVARSVVNALGRRRSR